MAAMKQSVAVRLAVVATVAGLGAAVAGAAPVQGFWDGGDATNPLVLRTSANWTGNHHPSSSEEAVLDFAHVSGNPDLPGTLYMGDGVNAGDNGFGYLTINSPTLQNIFTSASGGSGYTTVDNSQFSKPLRLYDQVIQAKDGSFFEVGGGSKGVLVKFKGVKDTQQVVHAFSKRRTEG